MKKITNFIIDKRYFILIIFLVFTIISIFLFDKVNINYDIAKYLPNSSNTRIGMDIMESEFSDNSVSILNVMFNNLEDKELTKNELAKIKGVKEVSYDSSSDYNKDEYTLYVLSIEGEKDSINAKEVYNEVTTKYPDAFTSGNVAESNKNVLPFSIIILAVLSALVILLIMCESYVEPFLFLTAILMAVVINKGTNIFFPSVSHITNSICSILQMALSMDYSIMLMNRYDEEKKKNQDKVKAMKEALNKSFQSISSSSITTIAGLLALIFMSFKIGMDLGLILAKGVLLSLLCIFFVLPSLILMFDKYINKTKKKIPNIKFNKLTNISFKYRYVFLPLFLIIFTTSFFLKGNLSILYTDKQADEISKIFNENNQIAIIYNNNDENKIADYLNNLEEKDKVKEVLGYSNTINEKLSYDKLNNKLKDLESNVSIEDYLLKIVYYNYFNKDNNNKITFEQFINFIEQEAYNNPKTNEKIDDNMKKDIARLKNFVTEENINYPRNSLEISNILEIENDKIKDLLIYFLALHNDFKLSFPDFINFINKDVVTNQKYTNKINVNDLNNLTKFINPNTIKKKMTYQQISEIFNINSNNVKELFKYYLSKNKITDKISINEFANFVLNNIVNDQEYAKSFDRNMIENIKMLSIFSNKETINKKLNAKELANLFTMKEEDVNNILLLEYTNQENKNEMTISDFINETIKIKTYLNDIDLTSFDNIKNSELINDKTKYSSKQLATLLKLPQKDVNKIYNLIEYNNNNIVLQNTPKEFVNLLLSNDNNLDKQIINKLKLIQVVINSSVNDTKYNYEQLANIININQETIKNIYILYKINNNDIFLTPIEFSNFILNNQNDNILKNAFNKNELDKLSLVNNIMNGILNNKYYSYKDISKMLNINEEDTKLLYGLYSSIYLNKDYRLSLKDFISFILNDVITNNKYKNNFDEEKITKLKVIQAIMNNSLNNVLYTKDEMFAIISKLSNDVEKKMIEVLYLYYGSDNNYNKDWQLTVEEFVNYLNNNIINDEKFKDYIDEKMKNNIIEAKKTIKDAKDLLVGDKYSRIILNTNLDLENEDTFNFIENIDNMFKDNLNDYYVIGDSLVAYEMSKTFNDELNLITIITMIAIFLVVALTFKSILIPIILVLIIQCAVYLTMGILSITGDKVYFISLLIVQSILMGATIDYAILYTSYYIEHRKKLSIKDSVIESYQKALHTILTSSSILIIVTLIIACFTSAIASKICKTISEGTICSTILILFLLPGILAFLDRFIIKKK